LAHATADVPIDVLSSGGRAPRRGRTIGCPRRNQSIELVVCAAPRTDRLFLVFHLAHSIRSMNKHVPRGHKSRKLHHVCLRTRTLAQGAALNAWCRRMEWSRCVIFWATFSLPQCTAPLTSASRACALR